MFIFTLIAKGIVAILKAIINLIVFFGLWIAMLYCGGFFGLYFYYGWVWADVSTYFYIGFAISLVLSLLWFGRFKLGIGKRKKNKKGKAKKSKSSKHDEDDMPEEKPKKKFFSL